MASPAMAAAATATCPPLATNAVVPTVAVMGAAEPEIAGMEREGKAGAAMAGSAGKARDTDGRAGREDGNPMAGKAGRVNETAPGIVADVDVTATATSRHTLASFEDIFRV